MAGIPMKQFVDVHKSKASDGWGGKTSTEVITHKVRVEETIETVTDRSGNEITTTMKVYFDKLADISYEDTIEYTNELGVTVKRKPTKITMPRLLSSKVFLTIVWLK